MRMLAVLAASIFLAAAPLTCGEAAEPERPSALDGSQYAVIAPVYDGSGGSVSFIRLFNSHTSFTSTFFITIVHTNSGNAFGTVVIQVPPNASPQFPLTPAGGTNSIFAQAGVPVTVGAKYAIYISNPNSLAGYQHVTFNGGTTLFLNSSVCSTTLNQQLASSNRQALPNLHTSMLSNYPSSVAIHNYAGTSTTVTLGLYDAATGTLLGQASQAISANGTLELTNSQLEALTGFTPTDSQLHINVSVSRTGSLPVRTSQTINNIPLGGNVDMSQVCAVNAVGSTPATQTTPTAYCGTITPEFPYNFVPVYFTASVATNGRVEGTLFGESSGYYVGSFFYGSTSGSSFTATSIPAGGSATGTIQNGVMSGTAVGVIQGVTVSGTITGSTTACSS